LLFVGNKTTFAHAKNTPIGFDRVQNIQITKEEKVNTLSYKTQSAKKEEVVHQWHVVDATNMTVGRLSSRLAHILRGKHKPSYTPHVDCGDYVIVLNAEKVHFTGAKWSKKEYIHHSGYPGGQKRIIAEKLLDKKPTAIVEKAVKGMLPKTKLGRSMFKKLFVYEGTEHPHAAQTPQTLELTNLK